MKRQHLYLIEKQAKAKVAVPAYQTHNLKNAWFVTLAAGFAGFFYFFGEYLWHALSGG